MLSALADATGFFHEIIEMDHVLETELGVNAMKRMEILGEVQKQLGIHTRDKAELCEAKTVGDVVAAMGKELANQSCKSTH